MAKDYKSVFDIIGPIMTGPSSSHTAGAARIGKMCRNIFGETPESANIYLYESFAETYRGHGTDVALVGGLLGMDPDDEHLHESLYIANEEGLKVNFIPLLEEKVNHPNTARFVMRKGDRKMSVTGISIGGGNVKITDINEIPVEISSGVPTILIFHHDCPGMIAKVANVVSDLNINIASMKVDRQAKGENAYMVIEMDQDELDTSLNTLRAIENIHSVMYVRK